MGVPAGSVAIAIDVSRGVRPADRDGGAIMKAEGATELIISVI